MKTVQIVVYDCERDEILSVGDLDLPSMEYDEQHQSGHEAANDVLESLGMECAIWAPLHLSEKTEIWQALLIAGSENEENPKELRLEWIPQMLASDFVDCKTDGSWRRKMVRKNLPAVIADDLVSDFNRKVREASKRGYVDEEETELK